MAERPILFNDADVRAILSGALRRGADARVLLRSPALASVEAKFKRMVPRTEPTRAERARRSSDG